MAKKTEKTVNQEVTREEELIEEQLEVNEETEETAELTEETVEEPIEVRSKEEILEEKLAELQNKYLRLSAEFDNYRKRTMKEKFDLQEGAKADIFANILPVVDDLDRALGSIENAADLDAVKEGMNLINSKFKGYLTQQGVKEIDSVGKKLDTDLHEAITKIPVESKKQKGKIVDVVEKGYLLKDRVIRFAKVVIGE